MAEPTITITLSQWQAAFNAAELEMGTRFGTGRKPPRTVKEGAELPCLACELSVRMAHHLGLAPDNRGLYQPKLKPVTDADLARITDGGALPEDVQRLAAEVKRLRAQR